MPLKAVWRGAAPQFVYFLMTSPRGTYLPNFSQIHKVVSGKKSFENCLILELTVLPSNGHYVTGHTHFQKIPIVSQFMTHIWKIHHLCPMSQIFCKKNISILSSKTKKMTSKNRSSPKLKKCAKIGSQWPSFWKIIFLCAETDHICDFIVKQNTVFEK